MIQTLGTLTVRSRLARDKGKHIHVQNRSCSHYWALKGTRVFFESTSDQRAFTIRFLVVKFLNKFQSKWATLACCKRVQYQYSTYIPDPEVWAKHECSHGVNQNFFFVQRTKTVTVVCAQPTCDKITISGIYIYIYIYIYTYFNAVYPSVSVEH